MLVAGALRYLAWRRRTAIQRRPQTPRLNHVPWTESRQPARAGCARRPASGVWPRDRGWLPSPCSHWNRAAVRSQRLAFERQNEPPLRAEPPEGDAPQRGAAPQSLTADHHPRAAQHFPSRRPGRLPAPRQRQQVGSPGAAPEASGEKGPRRQKRQGQLDRSRSSERRRGPAPHSVAARRRSARR